MLLLIRHEKSKWTQLYSHCVLALQAAFGVRALRADCA
jgi:hypothetical protein